MKKTIAILLALVFSMSSLAGCGYGSSTLSGKYDLVSMTSEGETLDAVQLKDFGIEGYFEFLDGGKVKVEAFGETSEGTFTVSGTNVTITIDGEPASGTISGNRITIEDDDLTMVIEKK